MDSKIRHLERGGARAPIRYYERAGILKRETKRLKRNAPHGGQIINGGSHLRLSISYVDPIAGMFTSPTTADQRNNLHIEYIPVIPPSLCDCEVCDDVIERWYSYHRALVSLAEKFNKNKDGRAWRYYTSTYENGSCFQTGKNCVVGIS